MSPGRRILLADDDDQAQRAVKRAAMPCGYEIVEVQTGVDVKRIALETQPDLILLDIHFPDADGRDILAQLKADPQTQAVPVLVWSARDSETDRTITLELGAEDYVEKGDVQTLLPKINRLLWRLESER
jgi:DNA-binding response OmpR family regulator